MAKKKASGSEPTKNPGTLIRVSKEFAEAIGRAASFEKLSITEYATTYLLSVVEKRYREAVLREAKRLEEET